MLAMNKEKYFIDLSKLSEEQRKSLPQILENAGETIYEETLNDLLNDRFDDEYIYLALFFDGEWLRFNDNLNRTELTYPDFIKLFEGGEGNSSDVEKWKSVANELEKALKGLYYMIGTDKKCGYDGLNYRTATSALEKYKNLNSNQ